MRNQLRDHIDAPMLKATVGLNLLGIKTVFSCCGFEYKGEQVPKKHILNKPYFFIDPDSLNEAKKAGLFDMMFNIGWQFQRVGQWIDLFYCNNDWTKNHPFSAENSPHKYEAAVLAINSLEKWITSNKSLFLPSAVIVDGNSRYKNDLGIKYWQYEPCEDWIVTPVTYDNV